MNMDALADLLFDESEQWFPMPFLNHPLSGWSVNWDAIDHTTPQPTKLGKTVFDRDEYEQPCGYMAGILVTSPSGRVWRLTGKVAQDSDGSEVFQGLWPD